MADVDLANRFLSRRIGTLNYAAGSGAGTVNVPKGSRVDKIWVHASGGASSVQLGGGDTLTIPSGVTFELDVAGNLGSDTGTYDIVTGANAEYFVSWLTGKS